MSEYGLSGSGTYAITLSGLDEMMSVLPDNNTNQIAAKDVRNVVYTLWGNGGGGGGSFSYTHIPTTELSTSAVGGIPVGSTFSNVDLQVLFDRMFYPAVGTLYNISTDPSSIELGGPNKTTIGVSITKKTPTITSAFVTSPIDGILSPSANIPTNFNDTLTTSYSDRTVTQDTFTEYTLSLNDGSPKTDEASVTWYFPRWYGSLNLNSDTAFGNPPGNFNAANATTLQKTLIINKLSVDNWERLWGTPQPISSITSFVQSTSQLGTITVGNGGHIVLVWPKTDYGGDGTPANYNIGGFDSNIFIDLGEHSVRNKYGVYRDCKIFISNYSQNSIKIIIT